jgi:hypothetical protein
MRTHLELPDEFFKTLHEGSRSARIDMAQSALLAVVNDVAFDFRMNVAGIPLGTDPKGFWILVATIITFTTLAGR